MRRAAIEPDETASKSMIRQILDIFEGELNVTVPSADLDLFESGVVDSSMFVDLLMHIEERFGVRAALEDLELDNFATVERIARFVEGRGPAAA